VPATVDTPFCVYSASKAITAFVVHTMIERGLLGLDDPVADYIRATRTTASTRSRWATAPPLSNLLSRALGVGLDNLVELTSSAPTSRSTCPSATRAASPTG
jgi:CubicO group peptidase (beta-lactamase class C family)